MTTEVLVQKITAVTGTSQKEIGRYFLVVPMSGVDLREGAWLTLVDRAGHRATGRVVLNHGSLVLDTSG